MITYQVAGPNKSGDYLIAYATPGMPHVLTVASVASTQQAAQDECTRLNEAQVVGRRAGLVRAADLISQALLILPKEADHGR